MKTYSSRFPRHQRGMALISVLAVLLLLTLLAVAFMSRTTSARAAANSFHATASTRLLADTAVNLVQAQINEATTLDLASGAAVDTWGSQPGAIRVYGSTGTLKSIYRLYSATPATAGTARVTPNLTDLASDLPANNTWNTFGAQWVDLNGFVTDSQGRYHFPIVDPRDPAADPTANPNTVGTLWKPTGNNPPLKGFSIYPPAAVTNSAQPVTPAPMPVRWLYMLKDGAIVSPDAPATPSNTLTFANAVNASGASDVPSVANPIVGRIAYWTDDDSSKININTAAGDDVVRGANQYAADSIFWATPAFGSPDEDNLAIYQPVHGEIQRYPGHPGTVGLNTTLSTLAGLAAPLGYDDFYSLLPRYAGGGSQSATVTIPYTGLAAPTIPLTASRLYTSVAEMLFKVPTAAPGNRPESALVTDTSESSAAAAVERSNFFLTAHSSSSELNLFGEPRISIWPYTTTYQTPTDSLLAFDSTVARTQNGAEAFYFQRTDPTSGSTDCTIGNNISLFNYLDKMTTSSIPGFGASFTSHKYVNPGMHQILSEMFDYVRTINMLDPLLVAQTPSATASYTYGQNWGLPTAGIILGGITPGNNFNYRTGCGGFQVIPSFNKGLGLNNWGTQGLGSFPIPIEVTVQFVAEGLGYIPGTGVTPNIAGVPEWPIPYQQYKFADVAHDVNGASDTIVDQTALPGGTASPEYDAQSKPPPTPRQFWTPPLTPPLDPLPPIFPQFYTTPASGKPADMTTAIQAFVLVSFLNPALIEAKSQPIFCYSINGLNSFQVTDSFSTPKPTIIPLHFPGNNLGGGGEQMCIVDNSDGGGFINGWIGDWMFGYIPWMGSMGDNNYNGNPGMLGPAQGTWSIADSTTMADGRSTSLWAGGNPYGRKFPFYSQLFCVTGQQGWPTTKPPLPPYGTANPNLTNANVSNTFIFSGGTITLNMYDYHKDGDSLNLTTSHIVNSYQINFPTAILPLPNYARTSTYVYDYGLLSSVSNMQFPVDSQVIGTTMSDQVNDRWHQAAASWNGARNYNTRISANDTVISMTLSPAWSDARTLALNHISLTTPFKGHPNLVSPPLNIPQFQSHDLLVDSGMNFIGNNNPQNWGRLLTQTVGNAISYYPSTVQNLLLQTGGNYPIVPPRLNGSTGAGLAGQGAYTTTGVPGDWDNGVAWYPDGPWCNMADEGVQVSNMQQGGATNSVAYFSTGNLGQNNGIVSTFSPNREVPSPGMFGSLPTGVNATVPRPWQTLLFRPGAYFGGYPARHHPGEKNQPIAGDPADHLLLDLFWMPQIEPYPISQPFVTEGKINLNYEIQPFTYIMRNTALRALFGSEKIAVMSDTAAGGAGNMWTGTIYKFPGMPNTIAPSTLAGYTGNMDVNGNTRLPIDVDQTLGLNPNQTVDPHAPVAGMSPTSTAQTNSATIANAWYDSGNDALAKTTRFFKSPSELCEMFLVPQGYNWQEFTGATYDSHSWCHVPGGDFALVGDNNREKPYTDLYSRVTTKSNTYTVYYTVQSLKNAEPQTAAGQATWDETHGAVTGEYRGSTTLERYLDPNEKMPDFFDGSLAHSLEPYYKWRILETRQFAP